MYSWAVAHLRDHQRNGFNPSHWTGTKAPHKVLSINFTDHNESLGAYSCSLLAQWYQSMDRAIMPWKLTYTTSYFKKQTVQHYFTKHKAQGNLALIGPLWPPKHSPEDASHLTPLPKSTKLCGSLLNQIHLHNGQVQQDAKPAHCGVALNVEATIFVLHILPSSAAMHNAALAPRSIVHPFLCNEPEAQKLLIGFLCMHTMKTQPSSLCCQL